MPSFNYTVVRQSDGQTISGALDAGSRERALQQLSDEGYLPIEVSEASVDDSARPVEAELPRGITRFRDVTALTREIAMLLAAGMTLSQALDILEQASHGRGVSRLLSHLRASLSSGKSMHEAMAGAGDAFSPVQCSMVEAAEAGGTMADAFSLIADAREREQRLRSKALSALIYPFVLIVIAICSVIVMLVVVVPRFKQMIVDAGAGAPDSAKVIIWASDWLIANWIWLGAGVGLSLVALSIAWRSSGGGRALSGVLLRTPFVGGLLRLSLAARFCRTLGILICNGVGLPKALTLVRQVVGDRTAAGLVDDMATAVRQGRDFTEPMGRSMLFPPLVVTMLKVGAETGNIGPAALQLAGMFEEQFEAGVGRLFALLEPAIVILVSLFVAGIILTIVGAVVSVNDLAI
ncbi:MAG: type II secretion system F family protein [Alphaproteobacteria bacterium]|nr:type II secretion system F family protein [Alphaproteobacteria bacterium]